ncbi:MAG: DUF192 domain-containing protein [Solirubrobacteraceae bacterium]
MTPRLSALPSRELAGGLRVATADSHLARLRGLAGLTALDADEGLELPRCRSVHTAAMRFPLDLVWLDGDGGVVRVDRGVQPFRMRSCRGASSVVEVAAGRGDAFAAALAKPVSTAPPGPGGAAGSTAPPGW